MRTFSVVFVLTLGILGITDLSDAQTIVPTADEAGYFVSLFESIGSPDMDVEALQWRESAMRKIYALDAKEAAIIHSVAQIYRSRMAELRLREKAVSGQNRELNNVDRSELRDLIAARDQLVKELATTVLNSLREKSVELLRVDSRRTNRFRGISE